jgi:phosphatidylethanolamine-binding protein (PEBP) family uncharacterized protein
MFEIYMIRARHALFVTATAVIVASAAFAAQAPEGGAAPGFIQWRGMCPPANVGTSIHHYVFRIRGTDLDPQALPPGLTAEELDKQLMGHARGQAVLTAKYRRPQ